MHKDHGNNDPTCRHCGGSIRIAPRVWLGRDWSKDEDVSYTPETWHDHAECVVPDEPTR